MVLVVGDIEVHVALGLLPLGLGLGFELGFGLGLVLRLGLALAGTTISFYQIFQILVLHRNDVQQLFEDPLHRDRVRVLGRCVVPDAHTQLVTGPEPRLEANRGADAPQGSPAHDADGVAENVRLQLGLGLGLGVGVGLKASPRMPASSME